MNDFDALWESMDAEVATGSAGVLVRRLNVPAYDVALTQERPSRLPGLLVRTTEGPGTLWKDLRSSQGLAVKVQPGPPGSSLQLTERDTRFHEIFVALVADLLHGLEVLAQQLAESRPPVMDFLAARISRWQTCLKANNEGLSSEKRAGLFGELSTLRALLDAGNDPTLVIDRWTGPSDAIQDFQFDTLTLEVKASRQTQPTNVRISSERQLDNSTHDRLLLVHYGLDERSDGSGTSLPEKVAEIRSVLGTGYAGLLFDDRLLDYGYLDLHAPRYADRSYAVRAVDHFDVRDPMARIVEADLPVGVGKVSYDLSLAACEPFRVDPAVVVGLLTGLHS